MGIDAKAVGKRIAQARADKELKDYRALADKLNEGREEARKINPETVRRWEVGKTIPPYAQIKLLAEKLEEPEEWFLFNIRRGQQLQDERRFLSYVSEQELALLTKFRATNPEGQKLIQRQAEDVAKTLPAPLAEVTKLRNKGSSA